MSPITDASLKRGKDGNSIKHHTLRRVCSRCSSQYGTQEHLSTTMNEKQHLGPKPQKLGGVFTKRSDVSSIKNQDYCHSTPRRTLAAFRQSAEITLCNYYSYMFNSHVLLPLYKLKVDGFAPPPVFPSKIRQPTSSVRNKTNLVHCIRQEHLNSHASSHLHFGSTLHSLSVRTQGSRPVEEPPGCGS
ncbi:hypothetical protein KIN20_022559 [Parelaphostrongylus tenuis]|uniref:Uncharacterized protein n=1 Tax=Parelaphostrongylus tenuis TaxID=148309 RepID=A0AAD5MUD2_PARTN|nr:hypothetical protein KIN20_022559 [Parelaphostrongylus tenuis]